MLLIVSKAALCVLLFLLIFLCIRYLGIAAIRVRSSRSKLAANRKGSVFHLPYGARLDGHLSDLMAATRFFQSTGMFLTITLIMALLGVVTGIWVFRSFRGVWILTAVLGMVPYLLLRFRLISRQLKTRLEFLPAVEVFYQQAALSARPNMRNVLQTVVSGDRLLYPIKPSFDQLQRSMTAGRSTEDALRIFTVELGHVWADYFANMLRMGMEEGVDITPNLKELIDDMRRAQLYDQKARNRLLEIRLASFSPVLFLILFLSINFKLNYDNAVQFYFMNPEGRNMLLHALLLMFGSFLMGIYLSMRRM
jgi:Flp pilus assembly protein TadB